MTTPYPLAWPEGMPRAKAREVGRFKTTLSNAMTNVETSLRLFGSDSGRPVRNVVISSNVTLGANKPADPGVAIWFEWDGLSLCFPVDRYQTVAANLQAIHHIIEARRVELRHGTLALVRATFQGFKAALPSPGAKRPWREVLGFAPNHSPSRDAIQRRYLEQAPHRHPDTGGSHEQMAELNAARDEALREITP